MKETKVPRMFLKAVIVALVLGIAIQVFVPRKLISDKENVLFGRMLYHGSEISIDEAELINILSKYKSRMTFQSYFPYQSDKIAIEIDLVDKNHPKHIILGEFNVWYESGSKIAYEILDAQELKKELSGLLKQNFLVIF